MGTGVCDPAAPTAGALEFSALNVQQSPGEALRLLGTRLLPHNTRRTTCPPAPLLPGEGPLILVPSVMRSGTHLMLDALFNNIPALRRSPLFLDFDAYARSGRPPGPLAGLTGITIKTHYPQADLEPPYVAALQSLAARAFILTPRRPAEQVIDSLARWGVNLTVGQLAGLEKRFYEFWGPFSPMAVHFKTLLDPSGVRALVTVVAEKTRLSPLPGRQPVMPARGRSGVYFDKALTRLLGRAAPRINTTIGYRLDRNDRS